VAFLAMSSLHAAPVSRLSSPEAPGAPPCLTSKPPSHNCLPFRAQAQLLPSTLFACDPSQSLCLPRHLQYRRTALASPCSGACRPRP
jgi:hypothetical protein